jgi:O-methyltransferase
LQGSIQLSFTTWIFRDSLKKEAKKLGIEKSRISFIDSDTYSSDREALTFFFPTLQDDTLIVLDDYYSYRGSFKKWVKRAFSDFIALSNIKVCRVFAYGLGGTVCVISEKLV